IPAFFFLTMIFGTRAYSCPYRNVEKGIILLYVLVKGINKLDCNALDGGYNLYINKLLDSSDELQYENFCYPIRKTRGIALTDEEKSYNDIFGSFRSKIEGHFGEMQSTFTKFSHTVVNATAEKDTFGLQYKLACLLLNIKRFAALKDIPTEQHHMFWVQDGFDYPSKTENLEIMYT
ncbi:hypothetical protein BC939DRAFT_388461, partial [Gamsiella multidivaricata]|uniref:uncharacterized protein n=1 Tax=Gamsiella multidivaricata TaxID=101098 RepID=UPI002220891E